MALQCNIDAKGKAVRLLWGTLFLIVGVGLALFWARGSGAAAPWIISGVIAASGAFVGF
jgi:hypothetical protein